MDLGSRILSVFLFFLIITGVSPTLLGQGGPSRNEIIRDSLLAVLPTAQDTQLAIVYFKLAGNGAISDSVAGIYAQKGLTHSDSIGYPKGSIRACFILGHLAFAGGDYLTALDYYKRGIRTAEEVQDDWEILKGWSYCPDAYFNMEQFDSALHYNDLYRQVATHWGDSGRIGDSYLRDGSYYGFQNFSKQSIAANTKAAEIYEAIDDRISLAYAYSNIALTLEQEGETKEAEGYFLTSLEIFPEIDDPQGHMVALVNYSILLRKAHRFEKADSLLAQATEILEQAKAEHIIGTYYYETSRISIAVNKADLLVEQGQYREAIGHLLVLENDSSSFLESENLASIQFSLSRCYLGIGDQLSARSYAAKAARVFDDLHQQNHLLKTLKLQVEIEEQLNAFESAFEFQLAYQALGDSIHSLERRKEYQSLLLDYEKEIDERTIAELEQETLKDQNQRNLLIALLVILGATAIFITLFFRSRQRQNQQMLEQERQLDRMKTRFFTQISHELRTPLTLILGPLEQLIEKQETEKSSQKLTLMRRNANRLLELVNQVMDLSKVQEGKLALKAAPIDIVSWTKILFSSFDSQAAVKRLSYTFSAPESEIPLFLDKEKYQQIVDNLLSNAMKFTPEGGQLAVKLQDASDHVQLMITDNGAGITAEELPHIFDAYYQASTAGDGPFEAGTGIGLALCKELVELHHGTIEVASSAGVGTTFTLTFPKGSSHLLQEQILPHHHPKPIQESVRFPSSGQASADSAPVPAAQEQLPLVLVAEDIPDMQEYLRSILGERYELLIASNGEEAFEIAQARIPDLVIADIMMPKMDGMEFVRLLKDNDKTDHIPVIFLSAKATMEDRLEGWRREAFAFLSKPFNPRELLLVVESALKMQQRMQARFQGESILKPAEVAVNVAESAFLNKLTNYLETNLDNTELTVEALASEMALSRSQLNRKLNSLTGQNPTIYIRNFRLQKAKQLLATGFGNISEVTDAVGISSPAYFSRIFGETFGISPSAFLKQPK